MYPGLTSPLVSTRPVSLTLFKGGENEDWQYIPFKEGPLARFDHNAFAHHSKESTCKCKESLFVYCGRGLHAYYIGNGSNPSEAGGPQLSIQLSKAGPYLNDFWEFRCVDDRSENYLYKWIKIETNLIKSASVYRISDRIFS